MDNYYWNDYLPSKLRWILKIPQFSLWVTSPGNDNDFVVITQALWLSHSSVCYPENISAVSFLQPDQAWIASLQEAAAAALVKRTMLWAAFPTLGIIRVPLPMAAKWTWGTVDYIYHLAALPELSMAPAWPGGDYYRFWLPGLKSLERSNRYSWLPFSCHMLEECPQLFIKGGEEAVLLRSRVSDFPEHR